jgi:RND family efflux transporter MFP subunit
LNVAKINKLIVLCCLLVLALAACGGGGDDADEGTGKGGRFGGRERAERQDPLAEVVPAWRGAIPRMERSTGRIEAREVADVHAQVSEVALEVNYDVGDYVHEGALLVRLRADELALQVQAAELALQEAELATSRDELELTKRRTDLARIERYFDPENPDASRLFSREAWDEARLERDKAYNAVQSSRLALSRARGEVAGAVLRLSQAQITAPISGFITERNLRSFELVSSGTLLFKIADFNVLEVRLDVAEARLMELREPERVPGVGLLGLTEKPVLEGAQVVVLAVTAFPRERFLGYVDRISPTVDEARGMASVTVRIIQSAQLADEAYEPLLEQLDREAHARVVDTAARADTLPRLRPGMWVDARIATDFRRDVLLIPGAAMTGDSEVVWIVEPDEDNEGTGTVRSVDVRGRRGVTGDGALEILPRPEDTQPTANDGNRRGRPAADIHEGTLVVVRGQTLRDGQRVRIRNISN